MITLTDEGSVEGANFPVLMSLEMSSRMSTLFACLFSRIRCMTEQRWSYRLDLLSGDSCSRNALAFWIIVSDAIPTTAR